MGVAWAEFVTNQPLDKETCYEREGEEGRGTLQYLGAWGGQGL